MVQVKEWNVHESSLLCPVCFQEHVTGCHTTLKFWFISQPLLLKTMLNNLKFYIPLQSRSKKSSKKTRVRCMYTNTSANLAKMKENLVSYCDHHHELCTRQQISRIPASAWKLDIDCTHLAWFSPPLQWKVEPILNHFEMAKASRYLSMFSTDRTSLCQTIHPNVATFSQTAT